MSSYWTTPVTNREPGARMTWVDMNRITNNLNYLAEKGEEHQLYKGQKVEKTEWTYNDYVTRVLWTQILHVLRDLIRSLGLIAPEEATYDTTYHNINVVEDLTRLAYERFNLYMGQGQLGKYVDTEVWTGDEYNLGGIQDGWTSPYRRIRHYCDTEVFCGDIANTGGVE